MTRQAISPRFAIRIRLNILLILTFGGLLPANLACRGGRNNSVYNKTGLRQWGYVGLQLALRLAQLSPNSFETGRAHRHGRLLSSVRAPRLRDSHWRRSSHESRRACR